MSIEVSPKLDKKVDVYVDFLVKVDSFLSCLWHRGEKSVDAHEYEEIISKLRELQKV